MDKFLIVGLGNIGEEYADTRHNAGFLIADAFANSLSTPKSTKGGDSGATVQPPPLGGRGVFSSDRYASVNFSKLRGRAVIIIKPTTYMNLSGKAVNYWMQQEKISIQNTLVIADDIALPFGTLRMRKQGSDGGHNGLADIITTLNTVEFPRLRFGIGSEFAKGNQVNYVLGKWSEEERKLLPERIDLAVQMIKTFITAGIERAMTDFNKR
jgi:PTH1 family peptidyl-tRNA hydrolase